MFISYLFNFEEEADVEQFTLGLILSGYKFEKYIESDHEDIVIQFDEAIDTDEQNFIKELITEKIASTPLSRIQYKVKMKTF